ncbi:MAG: SRPBCC domain-containing protein [Pseudomonadota bacterium]
MSRARLWIGAAALALSENAMASDIFETEISLPAPPETVWQAITEKRHVDAYYFAPLAQDAGPVGSAFVYGSDDAPMISGTVLETVPPHIFRHSFAFAHHSAAGSSEVTYRLVAEAEGTRLTITHHGFPADSQAHADIAMGWPIILDGLKAYLSRTGSPE